MGLLRLDEKLEEFSEEEIKKALLHFKMCKSKELSAGNFDFFIHFLKQALFVTQYICIKEPDKSKPFLIKLTNVFCLKNINIDELLELIKINSTEIDLSNYFYTGFFYKGMLFDRNWEGEISAIKNINFENGLLKIEIENLTYPHTGYILLELESNKIIGEQIT